MATHRATAVEPTPGMSNLSNVGPMHNDQLVVAKRDNYAQQNAVNEARQQDAARENAIDELRTIAQRDEVRLNETHNSDA